MRFARDGKKITDLKIIFIDEGKDSQCEKNRSTARLSKCPYVSNFIVVIMSMSVY